MVAEHCVLQIKLPVVYISSKKNKNMCERSKDDFLTVYRKTYTKKDAFRPEPVTHDPDYKDILAGPFTEYVVLNSTAQPEHPFEDINHCYQRLKCQHSKMKRYLDSEPDETIIAADYSNRGRTVYHVDYCDLRDGFESKKTLARKQVSLPSDWGEIPVTTQRASYRIPTKLATWNLRVKPVRPQRSVLQPNLKEREILQVATGESEYSGKISAVGNLVLEDKLHGAHDYRLQCKKYQEMLNAYTAKTDLCFNKIKL